MELNKLLLLWLGIILLCLLFLLFIISSASAVTYSINSSMAITNSTIILNISDVLYSISNVVSNVTTQTNVSIVTQDILYINVTNASCICGDCVLPNNISIAESSMSQINDKLSLNLDVKTTDMTNKIIDNINFQIKPTQVQLDALELNLAGCKENMAKVEMARYQAELQQEKWYLELERAKSDNNIWMYITLAMFILFMGYMLFIASGGNFFNKFKVKFNF